MRYLPTPLRNTRRAAVAVQVMLTLTVLLGMLAIVVDGGLLRAQRQEQQAAADAAALAYATNMSSGSKSATDAQASALAIAKANGAANDGTHSLITPNKTDASGNPVHGIWSPPISGNFKGTAGYVEVAVEYDEARLFSAVWGTGTLPVRARAVAHWAGGTVSNWGASILTLGTTAVDVSDNGNGAINVPGDIIANSNIQTNGNNASIKSGGAIKYVGTASGNISPAPQLSTITADPLAALAVPAPSDAGSVQSTKGMTINKSVTLQPGVYQGGITISGGTVTLSPGIYYLEGGGLSLSGQAVVTDNGKGVLIYNGETNGATNNPNSVSSISVTGQATLAITPMTSGTWQGISIFQDRNATAAMSLAGNAATNVAGMIYAPDSAVTISGNGNANASTTFITSTFTATGNGTFIKPTVPVPIPGSGTGTAGLVE